jgi:hypothetical protein
VPRSDLRPSRTLFAICAGAAVLAAVLAAVIPHPSATADAALPE